MRPVAARTAAPNCPYHKDTTCESGHSDPYFTRYYCPVPGCTFSVKQSRPRIAQRVEAEAAQEDFSAR